MLNQFEWESIEEPWTESSSRGHEDLRSGEDLDKAIKERY